VSEAKQRWRLVFRRDEAARYLSHLDAIHSWERALRRGSIPVAMSEGFNPRPRLAFAAPLQLGMLAEHELADLVLSERLKAPELRSRLRDCLPPGYAVTELFDMWIGEPALAPRLAAADYRLELLGPIGAAELVPAVRRLTAADSLPRKRKKDAKTIGYDLRPLVLDLSVRAAGSASGRIPASAPGSAGALASGGGEPTAGLWMRLRHSQDGGTGRVEEVVAALADDLGLRLLSSGGSDELSEPDGAAAPTAGSPDSATVEVVSAVRERLWLAEELGQAR